MIHPTNDTLKDLPAYCEPHNLVGSLANVSAFLMSAVTDVNWLGFYLFDGEKLILGPFQGRPACTQIQLGKGVCGTSAQQKKTIRVDDVDQFPGHIVCDSQSRSEIVVPIVQNGVLRGVLDVDSPKLSRFNQEDEIFFQKVVELLTKNLDFGVLK
ncbi:GAF domain-containing protein [bacterium]|nr:GAF domain-containing protein [bacterium]